MKLPAIVISSAGALVLGTMSHCDTEPLTLEELARSAVTGDTNAQEQLRAYGPEGLDAILALGAVGELADEAVDRVAGQKYGHITRLFWFDDLEAAKAEAKRTNKKILSLRLLGDLRDELSCANSRFFRTVLYVDPAVREKMTEYVLHWSSERDAPVMTIDFGDGRVIKRTVTGNSIHYVLDEEGRVLNAIPGLWGPMAFIEQLDDEVKPVANQALPRIRNRRVPAKDAMFLAVGKSMIEAPMIGLEGLGLRSPPKPIEVSERTRQIMRRENPHLNDVIFELMVERFEETLGEDTRQNRILMDRIQTEMARSPRPEMHVLNRWVYAEVFKTPATDPWLGLHDDEVYTGLQDAGIER